MGKTVTSVAFLCTFQANVGMINTHGESAGCHQKLFSKRVARLMSERKLDHNCDIDNQMKVMKDVERQLCDKYLPCLFF